MMTRHSLSIEHTCHSSLYSIIEEKGLKAFKVKNRAGITPSQYLHENPYTELKEKEIIHDYVMKMMDEGE